MLDLGELPLSGEFPTPEEAAAGLDRWPLRAAVCTACWWLQLADDTPDEPDVGGPAAAETSSTIRDHAEDLISWLREAVDIRDHQRIVEVASHGNILGGLLRAQGLAAVTVERHPGIVAAARAAGLDVVEGALDRTTGAALADAGPVDLVLDTFLLSHERRPGDELEGIAAAIGRRGLAVLEVEHALPMLLEARFDSVRHGHFSYVSLTGLLTAARAAGLEVVHALRTDVYGGSLRAVLAAPGRRPPDATVARLLAVERAAGIDSPALYGTLAPRTATAIEGLRSWLAEARAAGRRVAAYGAPTRGNTLLNAAGIDHGLIAYTADASPAKQGRVLPGSGIPIVSPDELVRDRPDDVLVLPWTIAAEIVEQLERDGSWGCRFVVPLPVLAEIPRR